MKKNGQEDNQLQQYLNKLLDDMPLLEANSGLTDEVMKSIQQPNRESSHNEAGAGTVSRRQPYIHGVVAMAATFLLIHSGVFHKILTIDSGIVQLSAYIEKLSHLLSS
ncbi:hypothetical protein [Paenibacillus eucommiae]|uniref:Uncharacterized protein n=1 Tax=Paenibacillus eucommiae TaxID=1355755 RepID=A0ABS4ITM6_9BACL|nr:hypothetical protein [Paenibacillus eucommiae]MBP1990924.1 hypothetical protein [Paenibacillus eucommiae]